MISAGALAAWRLLLRDEKLRDAAPRERVHDGVAIAEAARDEAEAEAEEERDEEASAAAVAVRGMAAASECSEQRAEAGALLLAATAAAENAVCADAVAARARRRCSMVGQRLRAQCGRCCCGARTKSECERAVQVCPTRPLLLSPRRSLLPLLRCPKPQPVKPRERDGAIARRSLQLPLLLPACKPSSLAIVLQSAFCWPTTRRILSSSHDAVAPARSARMRPALSGASRVRWMRLWQRRRWGCCSRSRSSAPVVSAHSGHRADDASTSHKGERSTSARERSRERANERRSRAW